MNRDQVICLIAIIFIIGMCIYSTISYNNALKKQYECGYIDACKDFYRGKLKYDLVEKSDGTKVWEKVIRENE